MRTKRSARDEPAAPISAALARRARRAVDDDPEGDGRAQLLRVVALLGIGLVAAAILLPSGQPAVVVPADTLQPASAAAAAPPEDAERDAGDPRPSGAAFSRGSSAASVAGDDLPRASTPPERTTTPAPAATPKRSAATPRRSTTRPKRRQKPKRNAPRRSTAPAAAVPTPAPAPSAAPPPARRVSPPAAAPAPRPKPRPAPRRSRGGPKAEFGGL